MARSPDDVIRGERSAGRRFDAGEFDFSKLRSQIRPACPGCFRVAAKSFLQLAQSVFRIMDSKNLAPPCADLRRECIQHIRESRILYVECDCAGQILIAW